MELNSVLIWRGVTDVLYFRLRLTFSILILPKPAPKEKRYPVVVEEDKDKFAEINLFNKLYCRTHKMTLLKTYSPSEEKKYCLPGRTRKITSSKS